jgi:hypothetical protein
VEIDDFHARRTLHRVKNVCKGTVPIGIMSALLSVPIPYNTLPLISLSLCESFSFCRFDE